MSGMPTKTAGTADVTCDMIIRANSTILAGAVSVSRLGTESVITTLADGDTLNLRADLIDLGGGRPRSTVRFVDGLTIGYSGSEVVVATIEQNDRLALQAATVKLNADTVSFAGLDLSSTAGVSTLKTSSPTDLLQLRASVIDADGRMQVSGSMDVTGGFDSLSCASGILTVGTVHSDIAGLVIGDAATSSNSFLWHESSTRASSSHWELIGGDLRVTRIRSDVSPGRAVSYTLRIADDDAFEIHQSTSNVSGHSFHRRVARFGGVTS